MLNLSPLFPPLLESHLGLAHCRLAAIGQVFDLFVALTTDRVDVLCFPASQVCGVIPSVVRLRCVIAAQVARAPFQPENLFSHLTPEFAFEVVRVTLEPELSQVNRSAAIASSV